MKNKNKKQAKRPFQSIFGKNNVGNKYFSQGKQFDSHKRTKNNGGDRRKT